MFSNNYFKNTLLEKYDMKTVLYYKMTEQILSLNSNVVKEKNNENHNQNQKNNINNNNNNYNNNIKVDSEQYMFLLLN